MPQMDAPRVAVLGAGPIGLEAALYAQALKFPVTVYERGRIGEHLQRWGHVKLFSPFGMNSTPLGRAAILAENPRHEFPPEQECITGRQHVAGYLEPLARSGGLRERLKLEHEVVAVGRKGYLKTDNPADGKRGTQPFRLLIREGKSKERIEEADIVLDCTGTYGRHRWLGDGGIPAAGEAWAEPHIVYGLEDISGERRDAYTGRNVLVVGSGYSAATTVCSLAALAEQSQDLWVIWLARRPVTQPLKRIANDPLKERDRLAVRANALATRTDASVEFHSGVAIEAVECPGPDKGFKVTARSGGKLRVWEVDRLIANVGYTPDTNLYRELQVHECYASLGPMALAAALARQAGADCLTIPPQGPAALRNPEPNFFILGSKSYGRNSHFLLRTGFEQVREVFTLITKKPDLNLHAAAR